MNSEGKNVIGSSPHTDWGYLTLILAREAGLEAFLDGEWTLIEPLEGDQHAFLINCGDWLAYHTKGKYASPLHRVRAAVDRERLSTVFFHYPDYNADGGVISSGLDSTGTEDYKNLGL
jgi:isopenicillin N synthase-like dioxygenase